MAEKSSRVDLPQYCVDTRFMVEQMEIRLNNNMERVWNKLDAIEISLLKRVPTWVVVLISTLTGLLGAAVAVAAGH